MPNQQETKFKLKRVKESKAFTNGTISIRIYTSTPQLNISMMGSYDPWVISDLQNALDEVLKFHGM